MFPTDPWCNSHPTPSLDDLHHRVRLRSTTALWLRIWWPALLWSAVIFGASTDTFSPSHTGSLLEPVLRWLIPSISAEIIDAIHLFIRKSAHFIEYFIFFLFLYRGIRGDRGGWHWSRATGAWFIVAAYSGLDEFHQSFVASRTASIWDSLLDSTGALFALLALFLICRFFPRSVRM